MGRARRGVAGLVLVAVAWLAGPAACTGGDGDVYRRGGGSAGGDAKASGPSPSPDPLPRTPPPPAHQVVRSAEEVCDFTEPFEAGKVKAYLPGGPAYKGPGPHPAVLFKDDIAVDESEPPQLPGDWTADFANDDTQLVVCQYDDNSHDSRTVGTCTYLGGSHNTGDGVVDVESARYIFRVFEAATGELVTKFALDGTTSPAQTCPDSALYPATDFQLVTSEALADRLRPFVAGRR
ncbi:hypothetical protein OG946_29790 [Streptomyces sp. NBC_01808]|uniref:hypothetical protein n=1 Tax=Streptomyces sp. NBC_01808 TaxID=2975947 RepID=UPI002DD7F148|nr:hypothetical protein [Streptomyces sp. NBC_01808]WSA41204.1 hypothetical protein OG946_29790 [Streptomyces sp. NBC_01808]